MKKARRRLEAAVEYRNYVGIQPVDRNGERCLLFERSAVQERPLRVL